MSQGLFWPKNKTADAWNSMHWHEPVRKNSPVLGIIKILWQLDVDIFDSVQKIILF